MEEKALTQERPRVKRRKLLYHFTSTESANSIAEHGLLASTETITPALEIAMNFFRSALTIWYPQKQDYDKRGDDSLYSTTPLSPLTGDDKISILRKIEKSNLPESKKRLYIDLANKANFILPNSRLGAIISFESNLSGLEEKLSRLTKTITPSRYSDFLQNYSTNKNAFVDQMESVLGECTVTFFDPNLNKRQLAVDMITSGLDHYLLHIGNTIRQFVISGVDKFGRRVLDDYLYQLESVQFPEPMYERYRTLLISSIERALSRNR